MMMSNGILFAVLCTIVTLGYGTYVCDCEEGLTIDTLGCHKDVRIVALYDVITDKWKHNQLPWDLYNVTLVKPYKCINAYPVCSMDPKPENAFVIMSDRCSYSELEKGERYLIKGRPLSTEANKPLGLYNKCNDAKKWQDVKSDESKIIQAVEDCTLTYET